MQDVELSRAYSILDSMNNSKTLLVPDFVTRDFRSAQPRSAEISEHGTHSVATLVGQGHQAIRGIAPAARLLVAQVAGSDGIAKPRAVVEAFAWLISLGAKIVIIPLGEARERNEIAEQVEQGAARGVLFFAAAGNGYPQPIAFPARHPLAIAVGGADDSGNLLPECSRLPRPASRNSKQRSNRQQ